MIIQLNMYTPRGVIKFNSDHRSTTFIWERGQILLTKQT